MNPWIEVTGWTLIHFVWQGSLLAIATAAALRLSRRRSPQARYGIACAGLASMVATATITAVGLWSSTAAPAADADAQSLVAGFEQTRAALRLPTHDLWSGATAGAVATMDAWLPIVVWVWVTGVTLLMVRFSGGCWHIRRLDVASRAGAPSRWQQPSERIARRLRVSVPFRVIESTLVGAPMVIGWMRPVILLPLAVATNMSQDQIEALLAHELAHIRRRDYAVNLLQTLAEALLFFHPGVWWVSGRIREEREHCCDDVAVGICGEAAAYAEALAELASWRRREATLAVGAAHGLLLGRIRRLLGSACDDRGRPLAGLIVLAFAVACVGGAAVLSPAASATGSQAPAPDWRVRTTDHFEIHHPPDLDLHAARLALDAERAYERVSGDLRHNLAFKVSVIVFRTAQELQQSIQGGTLQQPHGASFSDPSGERVLMAIDKPADQWLGILTHEVSHLFAFDIIPGTATPVWILEGLAEYERGAWDPSDLAALRELIRAERIPKLARSTGADAQNTGRHVYALGHAAFDFIEARWGKGGVRQFLLSLRQTARGDGDPYRAAFQMEQHEFDQAFETYLRERFARVADAAAQRFDAAATLRIEGTITALNVTAPAGLACIELWVPLETGTNQRWAIECGERPPDDLMRGLQPGDRVIVNGAPGRSPVTQRIAIEDLTRPSDGYTWRRRRLDQDPLAAARVD